MGKTIWNLSTTSEFTYDKTRLVTSEITRNTGKGVSLIMALEQCLVCGKEILTETDIYVIDPFKRDEGVLCIICGYDEYIQRHTSQLPNVNLIFQCHQ